MNNKTRRLTVGILGGMGARASVRFYDEVIQICTRDFGIMANDDFPRLLISNLPIPDIVGSPSQRMAAERLIVQEGKNLQKAGAQVLIMACNTAHLCLPGLSGAVEIPVLNLIEQTVKALPPGPQVVGVLATPTTLQTKLYQSALNKAGKSFILPDQSDQLVLEQTIRAIIADQAGLSQKSALQAVIERQISAGATVIVLGCTELGLLVKPEDVAVPLVDSVTAGARAVASLGLGKQSLAAI